MVRAKTKKKKQNKIKGECEFYALTTNKREKQNRF